MAAALCTIGDEKVQTQSGHTVRVTWSWTSATGGTVTSAVSTTNFTLNGYIASFATKPGATTPTSYTITLYDGDGRILATKAGASTTAVETHTTGFPLVTDTMYIAISSAGDEKTGSCWADVYTA
ncbi:MAG TPA: hypothetical protein VMZ92_21595 [Planctomycetota bacterium]|nr:hypothetical protein [Planctomycetota bacterium]